VVTFERFVESLGDAGPPEGLSKPLEALWWAGKNDWARAHKIAQDGEGTPAYDRVHAYLHRVEGDLPNARYWYRQAAQAEFEDTLENEWRVLVRGLLTP